MAIDTAGLVAKLKAAVQAAPSLNAWATAHGFKRQNVSAAVRGQIVPFDSLGVALGYRRVTVQAYLAPGEAVPMLPPGWEEVEPTTARPKNWTPAVLPPLTEDDRREYARAAGLIGGARNAAIRRKPKKVVDSIQA